MNKSMRSVNANQAGTCRNISVVILTYNSERTISKTVESAKRISDDVFIVDSYSTDGTIEIARGHGVNVVQHPFENYGAQRNWAIDSLPLKHDWELHLDADECLSVDLATRINELQRNLPQDVDGYFIPRLVCFLGRFIRHGGMYPIWHMRLFRRGKGRCEDRHYDQHFYVDGATLKLNAPIIDDIRMSLDEWVVRHNRWTEAEVKEIRGQEISGRITPDGRGDPVQKKRYLKGWYYHSPLFLRPCMLFVYRYFIRLGFFDGKEGLVFFVLQTFWFRFLVDAKLLECRLAEKGLI